MIMTLFNTALMNTLSPRIYQKIKDKKISDIAPIAYLSLGFVAAVNLILIVLAPEAVRIFAPAYTTLICYIFYDVFHYVLMTKICNKYLGGVNPYNLKYLLAMYTVFLILGFAMLFTYDYPMIRYAVIAAMAQSCPVSRIILLDNASTDGLVMIKRATFVSILKWSRYGL